MAALAADGGLITPFRRIIFALSLSDAMQSGALVAGPFVVPKGTLRAPWASGNEATCDCGGFFLMVGTIGVHFYTFTLCLFYLCRTKYGFTNEHFRRKIESKVHYFIVLCGTIVSSCAVVTENINVIPTRSLCYLAAIPSFCRTRPDLVGECTRGLQSQQYIIVITYILPFLSLMGVVTCLTMMCIHVTYRQRLLNQARVESRQLEQYDYTCCKFVQNAMSLFQVRHEEESDDEYLARHLLGLQMTQALLYVLSFFFTGFLTWVAQIMYFFGKNPNDALLYAMPFFYPLGGLFNIIIYTRPSVRSLRIRYSTLTWCRAFVLVIMAGGETPSNVETTEDRSCSLFMKKCWNWMVPDRDDGVHLGRVFIGLSDLSNSQMNLTQEDSTPNMNLNASSSESSMLRSLSACKFESENKLSVIQEIDSGGDSQEIEPVSLNPEGYVESKQMVEDIDFPKWHP